MVTKERYKSRRAAPIVIKFPVDIDDEEYDKMRDHLYSLFPVSIIEQQTSRIIIAIVPEGMVPASKDIKKFFADADIIVDDSNYDIFIEKNK